MDFIRDLAVTASIHTFGGLRSTPQQRAAYAGEEFEQLKNYWTQGVYHYLIAIDTEDDNKRVGYLLLNLFDQDELGRRQTFVEDIAALPEYWGYKIGHLMFDAATEYTATHKDYTESIEALEKAVMVLKQQAYNIQSQKIMSA